jgi:hypothetical protein
MVISVPRRVSNTIRLVLVGVAVVPWTAITAFSQNREAPAYNGGLTSQASPQTKCPPKPVVASAQGAAPAEPSTRIKQENLTVGVVEGSRESNTAQGEIVHDNPLSTTVEFLTKDSKKPAQCETKAAAASH